MQPALSSISTLVTDFNSYGLSSFKHLRFLNLIPVVFQIYGIETVSLSHLNILHGALP